MKQTIIMLSIILSFFGCKNAEGQKKTMTVMDQQFEQKLLSLLYFDVPLLSVDSLHKNADDYIILDARETNEFNISHIPNAQFVGYKKFNLKDIDIINKDSKIVVYCSVGYRSEKIARQIQKAGYSNVFNLYGSIFEWANKDYLIVDNKKNPANKIHTYSSKWSKWMNNEKIEKVY